MFSTATRTCSSTTSVPSSSTNANTMSRPAGPPPPPPPRATAATVGQAARSRASRLLLVPTAPTASAPQPGGSSTTTSSSKPLRKPAAARMCEAEKLARDNARMEERLNALRTQLEMQRAKYRSLRRVASAGGGTSRGKEDDTGDGDGAGSSIWRSGAASGGLSSHAREVLESQKRFLKLRALDKIEYIGTVPATVIAPNASPLPASPPSASSPSSSRPGSSSSGRKTWGSNAPAPKPGEAVLSNSATPKPQPKITTWAVPDSLTLLNAMDDGHRDTDDMSINNNDSGFFTPTDRPSTAASSSSRFLLQAPDSIDPSDAGPKRMTSLQSVYQFDQRLPSAKESPVPNPAASSTSWWDGHVDEGANQAAFQDAVREWRQGRIKEGNPQESGEDGSAASTTWWDGEYDEHANQLAFSKAVGEWRGATTSRGRPATTATCSVETAGGELQEARGRGDARDLVKLEFSEGLSLMERMLLRKWQKELGGAGTGRGREVTAEEALQSQEYEIA